MIVYKHDLTAKGYLTKLKLGIPENYRIECINEIYRLGDSMKNSTNIQGIMTSYHVWEESKVFNRLLGNILKIIKHTKDKMFQTQFQLNLTDAWGAIYKKGHYTFPHTHFPGALSFVYYLQGTPNTPLIFPDDNLFIPAETDLLLIFPAWVLHEVPTHEDNEDRVIVAGNLNFLMH